MTELTEETAYKIMALVDESPSEPYSFERRKVISSITDLLNAAWGTFQDEARDNYEIGYDTGYNEGRSEAEEESEERIQELENDIEDLEAELEDAKNQLDDAFAKGYETASRDGGGLESFELR